MSQPDNKWTGANATLLPPQGHDELSVREMRVFNNRGCCVSVWQFTADELAEINRTGRIFICSLSGPTQPPIYPGTEEDVRALAADLGPVWRHEASVARDTVDTLRKTLLSDGPEAAKDVQ